MTEQGAELVLHLEKRLSAPRDLVFAACIESDRLAEWWGPSGFTSPSVELDTRVGGRYRIAMQPPEGELFYLRGEFREVDRPHRLVYTFEWEEPDADDRPTIVTMTFVETEDGTTLAVDQGQFATEDRRALHQAGWTDTLDRLEESLASTRRS